MLVWGSFSTVAFGLELLCWVWLLCLSLVLGFCSHQVHADLVALETKELKIHTWGIQKV